MLIMIYFIRSGKTGPIKIGFVAEGRSLFSRKRSLQCGNPEELYTLGVLHGYGRAMEKALHKLFRAYSIRGEWFEANGLLIEFIYNCENDPDNIEQYFKDLGGTVNKGGRPPNKSAQSWVEKKTSPKKKPTEQERRKKAFKQALEDGSLLVHRLEH